MPTTELNNETGVESKGAGDSATRIPDLEYRTVFLESPNVFTSLFRQIRQGLREPRITVPAEYYRGDPKACHEERRRKLAEARHRRKEKNLELKQRTIPFEAGEPVSSN